MKDTKKPSMRISNCWAALPDSTGNSDPPAARAELTRSRQPAKEESKTIKGKFG